MYKIKRELLFTDRLGGGGPFTGIPLTPLHASHADSSLMFPIDRQRAIRAEYYVRVDLRSQNERQPWLDESKIPIIPVAPAREARLRSARPTHVATRAARRHPAARMPGGHARTPLGVVPPPAIAHSRAAPLHAAAAVATCVLRNPNGRPQATEARGPHPPSAATAAPRLPSAAARGLPPPSAAARVPPPPNAVPHSAPSRATLNAPVPLGSRARHATPLHAA